MLADGFLNSVPADHEFLDTLQSGPPYRGQGSSIHIVRPTRRLCLFTLAALATVFLIISSSAWLTICGALRSNAQTPGLVRRSLADDKDEQDAAELARLVEMCVEWEEELGFRGGAAGHVDSSEVEPQSKRARHEAARFEAADEFEGERSRGEAGSMEEHSLPLVQPLGGAGALDAAVHDSHLKTLLKIPREDAWLERIPDIHLEVERQSPAESSTEVKPADEQPSTSHAARAALSCVEVKSDEDLSLHPYVRLPEVLPGAAQRNFNIAAAFGNDYRPDNFRRTISLMRSLFLKPKLNSADMEVLIELAEDLTHWGRRYMSSKPRHVTAFYVARILAKLFLMFDYLVCAIELAGEKMQQNKWWGNFVTLFKIDYVLPEEAPRMDSTQPTITQLARHLMGALAIYKTGIRPAPRKVVELKRWLFFSMELHMFNGVCWNLWRQDDVCFRSSVALRESESDTSDENS